MVVEMHFVLEAIAYSLNKTDAFDLYFFSLLNEQTTNFYHYSGSQ